MSAAQDWDIIDSQTEYFTKKLPMWRQDRKQPNPHFGLKCYVEGCDRPAKYRLQLGIGWSVYLFCEQHGKEEGAP